MPHICPRGSSAGSAATFPPKPRGGNACVTLERENPQGNVRAHPRLSEHGAGTLPGLAAGFGEPSDLGLPPQMGPGRLRRISPGKRRPQRAQPGFLRQQCHPVHRASPELPGTPERHGWVTSGKVRVVALGINTQGWGYIHGYGKGWHSHANHSIPPQLGSCRGQKCLWVRRDTVRAGDSWNARKSHRARRFLELQTGVWCWFVLFPSFPVPCSAWAAESSRLEGVVGDRHSNVPSAGTAGVPCPFL